MAKTRRQKMRGGAEKIGYAVYVEDVDGDQWIVNGKVYEDVGDALELAEQTLQQYLNEVEEEPIRNEFEDVFEPKLGNRPSEEIRMFAEIENTTIYIMRLKFVLDQRPARRRLLGKIAKEKKVPEVLEREIAEMSGIRGQ
jgi:hypothetical protein